VATAIGLRANLSATEQIQCNVGVATASGLAATISTIDRISAATAVATASGLQASILFNERIDAAVGVATASGLQALISTGAEVINCGIGSALASGLICDILPIEGAGATILVSDSVVTDLYTRTYL